MSNRLLRAAFEVDGLSLAEKATLVSLADQANSDDGSCFPSIKTTAERIGADEKTVRRALPRLVAAGHITIERRGRGFGYRVHPQCGHKVRGDSGQRVRSEADFPSLDEDTKSGDSGQRVRSMRAESPPNHHEPSINPQTTTAARGARGGGGDSSPKRETATPHPMPDGWQPSTSTIERLTLKGYRDLDARLDDFRLWARTANGCKDWDGQFEKAVLRDWAALGKPIDFEALNRAVEERDAAYGCARS